MLNMCKKKKCLKVVLLKYVSKFPQKGYSKPVQIHGNIREKTEKRDKNFSK